jgi:transposase
MARPRTEMTDDKIEAILRTVRLGLHPDRAAMAHGVSPGTVRSHKKRHPEFATAIKEAEAAAEQGFLGRILKHTEKQWTAAAWMLERRWPERWAKREVVIDTTKEDATRLRADLDAIDRLEGRRAD